MTFSGIICVALMNIAGFFVLFLVFSKIRSEKAEKIPCVPGDTVYVIPSEIGCRLNILNRKEEENKIRKRKVFESVAEKNGEYYLIVSGRLGILISECYGSTWFTNRAKADRVLKKRIKNGRLPAEV